MEKIWLKNYQTGVPPTIDPDSYGSIGEMYEDTFKKFGPNVAFSNMGETLTFKELDEMSLAFAAYLEVECKMKKGDRVALMMPNVLQYPVAMLGALRAGMVVVNVNPLYTPHELVFILRDSGAKAIVILENFAHVLEQVIRQTSVEHIITTQLGDLFSMFKSVVVNFAVKYIKKMIPPFTLPKSEGFVTALRKGSRCIYTRPSLTGEDMAFLQYTGGTTGRSKGAILSHRNMISNVLQASAWIEPFMRENKPIGGVITALPLYHIFSLTANCIVFGRFGHENILITNPRDIPGFIKELKRRPYCAMTGVNTLFNALLHNEEFCRLDFSNFLFTLGGGMAVQEPVAQKWRQVTGRLLVEAYGLTETSPAVCINPLNVQKFNGTIGLPVPSTNVRICDESGNELPLGEVGELCVQGPQVMQGYWQNKEETERVFFPGGWLRTGDLGFMNKDGFVKLVDRMKDMIIVSGFNVYPNEIEEVIAKHPKVKEVAVVGVPSAGSGERVKAFVVKNHDSLTEAELLEHCGIYLTNYKIPKEFEFRDELPKTNVGKVLRRALREPTSEQS